MSELGPYTPKHKFGWITEGELWWRCDQAGDYRIFGSGQTRESIIAARAKRQLERETLEVDRDRAEAEDVAIAACGGSKD